MDVDYPGFGTIVIAGKRYDHDVVVDAGQIRERKKKPSKPYRSRYGHTPLSIDEDIPWTAHRLVVGTGASGRLPIMAEVVNEAEARGVELIAIPTADACRLLAAADPSEVCAILHVTC